MEQAAKHLKMRSNQNAAEMAGTRNSNLQSRPHKEKAVHHKMYASEASNPNASRLNN